MNVESPISNREYSVIDREKATDFHQLPFIKVASKVFFQQKLQ